MWPTDAGRVAEVEADFMPGRPDVGDRRQELVLIGIGVRPLCVGGRAPLVLQLPCPCGPCCRLEPSSSCGCLQMCGMGVTALGQPGPLVSRPLPPGRVAPLPQCSCACGTAAAAAAHSAVAHFAALKPARAPRCAACSWTTRRCLLPLTRACAPRARRSSCGRRGRPAARRTTPLHRGLMCRCGGCVAGRGWCGQGGVRTGPAALQALGVCGARPFARRS